MLMDVMRLAAAPAYHPANHHDMRCLRLQGQEATPTTSLWLGLSHLLPGGYTSLDASSLEKLYVVVEGEVTIVTEVGEATLGRLDSCRIAPGERRRLENRTNRPASILLAMPHAAA
jgi:mannose-6-phosphate isomerase-like protein (cupin superfamily)